MLRILPVLMLIAAAASRRASSFILHPSSLTVGGSLLLVLIAASVPGCSRPEPPKYDVGNAQVQGHYDRKTGKLASITYDANNNGKIDTWSFMDGTRVVRIEIDKDEDGKIDRWEYYTADQKLEKVGYSRDDDGRPDAWAYQGPDGKVSKIELAALSAPVAADAGPGPATPGPQASDIGHRTSDIGRQNSFGPGQAASLPPLPIVRTEFYENGVLVRAEDDTNADGKVDKWETYRDGALATAAFDTAGRGTPNRRLVYGPNGAVKVETGPSPNK